MLAALPEAEARARLTGMEPRTPRTITDPEAILAIAREHEVPIYENAELVRLLARLELGEAIPEQLYRCIAEIIAFAWHLKGKCPPGFGRPEHSDALPLLLTGPPR